MRRCGQRDSASARDEPSGRGAVCESADIPAPHVRGDRKIAIEGRSRGLDPAGYSYSAQHPPRAIALPSYCRLFKGDIFPRAGTARLLIHAVAHLKNTGRGRFLRNGRHRGIGFLYTARFDNRETEQPSEIADELSHKNAIFYFPCLFSFTSRMEVEAREEKKGDTRLDTVILSRMQDARRRMPPFRQSFLDGAFDKGIIYHAREISRSFSHPIVLSRKSFPGRSSGNSPGDYRVFHPEIILPRMLSSNPPVSHIFK